MNDPSEPFSPPQAFPLQKLELLGAATVSEELDLSRRTAETLMYSEFYKILDGVQTPAGFTNHLDRPVITRQALDTLKAIPFASYNPEDYEIVNVRVREARRVSDSDREFMGWHPELTEHEADLATSRWWPIPRHNVIGHTFLVTVGGFVVRSGRILGAHIDRNKIAYTLDWNAKDINHVFLHHRIETPRGGTAVYLQPSRE